MSKKMMRVVAALSLLITLTAGAASAAPWLLDGPELSPIVALWDWIVAWLDSSTPDEGPHMDPNGGETTDEGSGMDPNG